MLGRPPLLLFFATLAHVACHASVEPELKKGPATPSSSEDESDPPAEKSSTDGLPEWVELAKQGLAADKAGKFDECIEKDQRAIKLSPDQPVTHVHLASCQAKAGKLIFALRSLREARRTALRHDDDALAVRIVDRYKELFARLGHVAFVTPKGARDLRISFDGRPVPSSKLGQPFLVDPGKHTIHADAAVEGEAMSYEEEFLFTEGGLVTVRIKLRP